MEQMMPFEASDLIVAITAPATGARFPIRAQAGARAMTARVTNLGDAPVTLKWGGGTVTGVSFADGHVTVLDGSTEPFTIPANVTHVWAWAQTGSVPLHITLGVSF